MPSAQSNNILISQLYDALPVSVVWFKPVFGGAKGREIIDFEFHYCNDVASGYLKSPKNSIIGTRLVGTSLVDDTSLNIIFSYCKQVWESGEQHTHTYFNERLNSYLEVVRSKVLDGVISVTSDRTPEVMAELERLQQTKLINGILDNSATAIGLYESVRDQHNAIIDFKPKLINKKTSSLLGFKNEELRKKTVKELIANRDEHGFYDIAVKAVETGHTQTFEYFSPSLNIWVSYSLNKHEDGFLFNAVDISHTKRLEQLASQKANELDAIFNSSLNAVYVAEIIQDKNGYVEDLKFLSTNKAFEHLSRYKQEIIGKTLKETSAQSFTNGFIEYLNESLAEDKREIYEVHYNFDGEDRWYNFSAVKIASNKVVVTYGDITVKKRAEVELKQQNDFLNGVLDSSINGVVVYDAVRDADGNIVDLNITKINNKYSELLGLSVEDVMGTSYLSRWGDAVQSGLFKSCCDVIETGKPYHEEVHYQGDGLDSWYDISMVKLGENGLVAHFSDISESKRNKIAIEESAAYLQTLIDSSSTGILLLSPLKESNRIVDFVFKSINKKASSYAGKQPEEMLSVSYNKLVPGYHENGVFEKFVQVADTSEEIRFESEHAAGGSSVWFDTMAKKVGDDVFVNFHDITNVKTLQLQLQHSLAELQASHDTEQYLRKLNDYKDEFLNIASHELKTPITSIKAYLQIMQNVLKSAAPEAQPFLQKLLRNVSRLERLITDLLDVSKASAGQLNFNMADISINTFIADVAKGLQDSHPDRKIILANTAEGIIHADETRLEQVLNNLVQNALKYSDGDIEIQCYIQNRQVNMVVKDSGIGIDEKDTANLFNRFYRSGKISGHYQGLGLGLYLSKQIVEAHNGNISVQSEPGKGSAFRVILPVTGIEA